MCMNNDDNNGHPNGDEEFKDFLDKENAPIEDQLNFIVDTIDRKATTIISLFSKSVDFYKNLKEGDPLRDIIKNFIINLIDNSNHVLNQYDYALIDSEPEEEEDGKEWYWVTY